MREWLLILAGIGLVMLGVALGWTAAYSGEADDRDTLFQVSTIEALLVGGYDGVYIFDELSGHGDFGIGTFDGLDGEMIAVDGIYYQVKADGKVYPVNGSMATPFATVTYFDPDLEFRIENAGNFSEFNTIATSMIPSRTMLYAVRIDGRIPYVKARAIPRQQHPYPLLVDAAKEQSIFLINNTNGTIVGFYTPSSFQGLNVPGFHLHYIDSLRSVGGHILDFSLENATMVLDATPEFALLLPHQENTQEIVTTRNLTKDLESVEKGG
ncbi:MAG TPA: acetolactate decarboxylase [Methanoregulaceae archaeon]|nr:acetolactate decarboxylase [Methanoregulaceae archaeon]